MSPSNQEFAKLFTGRLAELDLSAGEVADQLDLPFTTVRGWEDGMSLPGDGDVEPVAQILALPRALVREALRRSADPGDEPDDPEHGEDDVLGTTEEIIAPEVITPGITIPGITNPGIRAMSATAAGPEIVSRATEMVKSPFRALKDRLDDRRWKARAPTANPSYLEDSRQRLTYRVRTVLTIGGVLALVLVLRWAFSGFGEALSQLWDSLTSAL